MIDDPGIYMPDWNPIPIPDPVPAVTLEPEPTPEPEPAPDPVPDPAPTPEPEEPPAPVEVIPVEDLLDRLTGGGTQDGENPEELPQEMETEPPSEDAPAIDGESIQVFGMDTALKRLEAIQETVDHPLLTTPFEDYTVTEGLLLLLFLSVIAAACVKMLKGGFAWLR